MIRVYFVYEDPLDETGINLSFVDVPTRNPRRAFLRVRQAAESGELWKSMYPDEHGHSYSLIESKMTYLEISRLRDTPSAETTLPM